jgi:DNA-binding MarR family transcriptional regulator
MGGARDDDRASAWLAMVQSNAAVTDALDGSLQRGVGISLTWHEVLAHLADAPEGRLRMHELARSVLLSKSGVTRLVDRLADAGLVTRDLCSPDRRGVFAAITPAGRDMLDRAGPVFASALDDHFGRHLDQADVANLQAVLGKLLLAHGRDQEPTCPSVYGGASVG